MEKGSLVLSGDNIIQAPKTLKITRLIKSSPVLSPQSQWSISMSSYVMCLKEVELYYCKQYTWTVGGYNPDSQILAKYFTEDHDKNL